MGGQAQALVLTRALVRARHADQARLSPPQGTWVSGQGGVVLFLPVSQTRKLQPRQGKSLPRAAQQPQGAALTHREGLCSRRRTLDACGTRTRAETTLLLTTRTKIRKAALVRKDPGAMLINKQLSQGFPLEVSHCDLLRPCPDGLRQPRDLIPSSLQLHWPPIYLVLDASTLFQPQGLCTYYSLCTELHGLPFPDI